MVFSFSVLMWRVAASGERRQAGGARNALAANLHFSVKIQKSRHIVIRFLDMPPGVWRAGGRRHSRMTTPRFFETGRLSAPSGQAAGKNGTILPRWLRGLAATCL